MAVDAHCHLGGLKEWKKKDVLPIITGYSHAENKKVVSFANKENLPFAIGIAPQIAMKECPSEWIAFVEENASFAVGEVGLDYHWAKKEEERKKQKECFAKMVEIAMKKELPLVLHTREQKAIEDVIDYLIERNFPYPVMFHFYSGNASLAEKALKALDAYFSIPPLHSKNRRKTIEKVGLERVVVETDSPYIVRTTQEVKKSIEYVAEVLKKDVKEVEIETSLNAAKIFKLSKEKVLEYTIFE